MKTILTIASLAGLVGCGSIEAQWKDGSISASSNPQSQTTAPDSQNNGTTTQGLSTAKSFSVTPAGCDGESAQFFDNGNGIAAFTLATCTDAPQVYATLFSYEGVAGGASRLLSDCRYGVEAFAIDKGPNSYLLSYACQNSGDYSIFIREVGTSLTASIASKIDSILSANTAQIKHKIAWNPEANKFGYASVNGFASIDETGTDISGFIPLSEGNISELVVNDGKWISFQNSGVDNHNITIINPDGSIDSSIPLNIHREGSNQNDSIIPVGSFLFSDSEYAQGYRISSSLGLEPSPLFSQGNVGKPIAGVQIDNRTGYALIIKDKALVLTKIKLAGIPSIESEIAIATKDDNATIKQIKNSILVSHKSNDKVVISH